MNKLLMEIEFNDWLRENHKQITQPQKYIDTIKTISNDLKRQVGIDSLWNIIEISRIKELYELYFNTPEFNDKNTRGNRMYSRAFDLYIAFMAEDHEASYKDIVDIIKSDKEGGEKQTLILARLGQGRFKKSLVKKDGGCAISGYRNPNLLIASHIKPWNKCNNFEKVDPDNGLLLLPNYDKLFDKGLISFDDDGNILISELFPDAKLFGITKSLKIKLNAGNKKYMEYHRLKVFVRSNIYSK